MKLTPQELVEHLEAAGISRDGLLVRALNVIVVGKDGIAIALDADTG